MKFLKFIIISFFLFIFSMSFSQTPEIDSLRKVIPTIETDTTKVNSLNELGQMLIRVDLYYALDTINLSIKIAKKSEFNKGLAMAYKIKGIIYFYKGQTDTSLNYFYKSLDISEKSGDVVSAAKMYNNIGIIHRNLGNIQESINSYLKAIELLENSDEDETLITIYINASNVFRNAGNYQRALEFNYNALNIISRKNQKTLEDSLQTGHIYKSIANIYSDQEQFSKAENNYKIALEIYIKNNSQSDIGDIYLNLGNIQPEKKGELITFAFATIDYVNFTNDSEFRYQKAINYYQKALALYQNKSKIATANLNIGETYSKIEKYDSAKIYLDEALKTFIELEDKRGIALTYTNFGLIYNEQDKYLAAINNLEIAIDTAKIIGDISIIKMSSEALFYSYKNTNNYEKALEMHELFKEMNDSIFNSNNERSLTQMSMSYEFEKEQEQAEIKHKEEIKRQKIVKYFSFAVLLLVVIVLISVFSSLRTKKRKNEELQTKNAEILQQSEEIITQRDEIEEQNKKLEKQSSELEKQRDIAIKRGDEIEASIRYALRIQEAIMPALEPLKSFSDYFVFYRPRDIVSGDFYWTAKRDDKIITVAADCTGHGVPGAFMSMLGISFFNQIISETKNLQSDVILNTLREMIISSLKQDFSDSDGNRDGMDVAITIFDEKTKQIQYSGAYNSMYIITKRDVDFDTDSDKIRIFDSENCIKKLYEVKADRMPVGVFIKGDKPFTNNTFQLEKGDKFYIFSDGYHDLFNRDSNRKFTTKRYKELLLKTSELSMNEQEHELKETYLDWKGDYKQIDDIIVIGVEI